MYQVLETLLLMSKGFEETANPALSANPTQSAWLQRGGSIIPFFAVSKPQLNKSPETHLQ